VEATAWCGIALRNRSAIAKSCTSYLLASQNPDGGWSTSPGAGGSDWTSSLAVLALSILARHPRGSLRDTSPPRQPQIVGALTRALKFLWKTRFDYYNELANILMLLWKGKDADYPRGWSWTPGTYNWVEPTAYAVLALRSCGDLLSPQQKLALDASLKYLLRQACKGGGWNYGCPRILGVDLPPMPVQTAIACLSFQGLQDHSVVADALARIADMPGSRSLLSLSWTALSRHSCGLDTSPQLQALSALLSSNPPPNLANFAVATIAATVEEAGNPLILS
jgi:hypothetical protein